MNLTERINQKLNPIVQELTNHRLYRKLKTLDDIKVFTQYHVFCLGFYVFFKSLQNSLTCVRIPWLPNNNPNTACLCEIVLGEETDVDKDGFYKSHFDMYIDAMQEIGSDTNQIFSFISCLRNHDSVSDALNNVDVDPVVSDFVSFHLIQ